MTITASMLYDLVQCAHRPTMDLYGDPEKRDEINPFVRLLWEKGNAFEEQTAETFEACVADFTNHTAGEKEISTLAAIERRETLIYGGRIRADDLLGEPDLLRREGSGYVAGDIKSGAGEEGQDGNMRLKKHYGVQLALYTDILERLGYASSRRPFIWDVGGNEVTYDLEEPQGQRNPTSLWSTYQRMLSIAQRIVAKQHTTLPAYGAPCKVCHWRSACIEQLEALDDLTLIPELGRSKRDAMVGQIATISDLAQANIDDFLTEGGTVFRGIGEVTLRKFHDRAVLSTTKGASPYLTTPLILPSAPTELFFDIEFDPMRNFCYLHGFIQRLDRDTSSEKYTAFFVDQVCDEEEERVFIEALDYIRGHQPCVLYYFSKYERSIWRRLQQKYPHVCSAMEIETLFDADYAVDLYSDVVTKMTEWPTRDYSIKTLAAYLGFTWRDKYPSGAASIEWFDQWVVAGDKIVKQRILDYNEDDCRATRVLLDGIREL